MSISIIPQLRDNYAYLIFDGGSRECAVIDCSDPESVLKEVSAKGGRLTSVLTTHWHLDHSGGNEELAQRVSNLKIFGGMAEKGRVPAMTHSVVDGDEISIGKTRAKVIAIPAHTSGHVAYYFPSLHSVFTGDTLFIAGCGRIFEGQADVMLTSLERLASLPKNTKVYCGHEYTKKNLQFALTLEPENEILKKRYEWCVKTLDEVGITVPSTIGDELMTNPFLRSSSEELIKNLRKKNPALSDHPVDIFKETRMLKDAF